MARGAPFAIQVTPTAPPPEYADRLLKRSLGLTLKPGKPGKPGKAGGQGVLIDTVREGSLADKAGLRQGDLIVALGEERIAAMADARRAVLAARGRGRLRVSARRGNTTASFVFPFE